MQLISTESWAGDNGHQSQESTRDGEALEGSAVVLSFSFSNFVFSSITVANIHRITWVKIKRAGDDGYWKNYYFLSLTSLTDVSASAGI